MPKKGKVNDSMDKIPSGLDSLFDSPKQTDELKGEEDARNLQQSKSEGSEDEGEEYKAAEREEDDKAAESEVVEDEVDDSKDEDENKDVTNFKSKFEEEQGYRQRLSRELKSTKEELTNLRNQFHDELLVLRESVKGTKEKAEAIDPEVDPVGFIKNEILSLRTKVEELASGRNTDIASNDQVKSNNKLIAMAQRSFNEFGAKNEEFKEALAFLQSNRINEFKLLGYDDDEAGQIMDNDVLAITKRALELDQSPAEVFWKIAKQRGYKSKKDIRESVSRVNDGMTKNKSLSSASGERNNGRSPITVERLLNARDDEFDSLWNKFASG